MPPPTPKPAHDLPLPPARVTATGVRVLTGVPYADLPGVRPLELDLYLPPAADTPAPVVVFLHGGGWRVGSRRSLGPSYAGATPHPFEQVAAAGIAVASVDYRLSGEQTWPAQLHDAKASVRWLRARVHEVGLDPERIGAWGESAGGHLALLLGLTGPENGSDLDGDVGIGTGSSAVSAVAAWYPPSDLTALPGDLGADPAADDTREAQLFGAPLSSVPEVVARGQPDHVRFRRRDTDPVAARRFRPPDPVGPECPVACGAAGRRRRRGVRDLSGSRPPVARCSRGRRGRSESYGHVLRHSSLSESSTVRPGRPRPRR